MVRTTVVKTRRRHRESSPETVADNVLLLDYSQHYNICHSSTPAPQVLQSYKTVNWISSTLNWINSPRREYSQTIMPTGHTEYTEYMYPYVLFILYSLYIYSNNTNGFYLEIIFAIDIPVYFQGTTHAMPVGCTYSSMKKWQCRVCVISFSAQTIR
jgi:hypothetical protein